MELEGKVALVTGAGSGIGAASARLMAAEGARVAVLSRTRDELEQVAEDIEGDGGETLIVTADISHPDEMKAAVDEVAGQWGRLDVVFANAGVNGKWAPLDELTAEDWDETLGINLKGTFLTVKYALPHLKQADGGSVIVTSSINGTRKFSDTGSTAYSCSKAAQVAFVKMTALELAPHGIRINAICPGWIDTEIDENTQKVDLKEAAIPAEYPEGIVPLTGGEPGQPEDVARLVLFLASDASRHITGTPVWVDGGQSLLQG